MVTPVSGSTCHNHRFMMWKGSVAQLLVIVLATMPFGCGGGSTPGTPVNDAGPDAGVDDGAATFAGCVGDPRGDLFAPGMIKTGFGGRLQLRLLTAQPGPPIKGTNTWTVEVDDAAGLAQPGAVIKVSTYMPDHGHSSPVAAQVTAQATAGQYQVDPLYFFMAGLWQVTLDVTTSAGVNDAAMFSFCVER
jgi:hypothetical protein